YFLPLTRSSGVILQAAAPAPVNGSLQADRVQAPLAHWHAAGAYPSTVLTQDVGRLLGDEHEPGGVMRETSDAGTPQTTGPTSATDALGAAPSLFAWTADTPWIDGFASQNRKTR